MGELPAKPVALKPLKPSSQKGTTWIFSQQCEINSSLERVPRLLRLLPASDAAHGTF